AIHAQNPRASTVKSLQQSHRAVDKAGNTITCAFWKNSALWVSVLYMRKKQHFCLLHQQQFFIR
ncbi:hypothetical protein, partial [Ruegeria denitrificans]|uniref:hypothetical protein n=1 Tax=Ruegeria denitrificans TaxID=1715692 RepID=UPI001A94D03C